MGIKNNCHFLNRLIYILLLSWYWWEFNFLIDIWSKAQIQDFTNKNYFDSFFLKFYL
jgi:hypothetical protein